VSKSIPLKFVVNGKPTQVSVPPMKRLLDVLREECRLTGTKEGCGEGECGACTVLLDGQSVNSCLVPAFQAEGRKLITVEGLAKGRRLTLLQQAFVEMGGAQCGICTPGILVSSFELVARSKGRVPSEDEVREALAGNLCRCTGYQKIIDSVRAAANAARRGAKSEAAPRAKAKVAKTARAKPRAAKRVRAKAPKKDTARPAKPARAKAPKTRTATGTKRRSSR